MGLPKLEVIEADVMDGLEELRQRGTKVDMICTSPPYWRQRFYHTPGQYGQEATSQEYVDRMVKVFVKARELEVLKPHGLIFLNLGDSYNASGGSHEFGGLDLGTEDGASYKRDKSCKPRDLMGVPWRVYEGLRQSGYYLRSVVVWAKPNGMPFSGHGVQWVRHKIKVKEADQEYIKGVEEATGVPRHMQKGIKPGKQDNFGNSAYTGFNDRYFKGKGVPEWELCPGCHHCLPNGGYVLQWGSGRPTSTYELIAILTQKHYYWDTEAVRTKYAESSIERKQYKLGLYGTSEETGGAPLSKTNVSELGYLEAKYAGANLRDVWSIATASFSDDHYAVFPERIPELCILAGSSEKGCCSACGKPWARMLEQIGVTDDDGHSRTGDVIGASPSSMLRGSGIAVYQTVGWKSTCKHPEDTPITPAVVLDPFCGAGTTLLVANKLGRDAIGIEINPKYAEMARHRVTSGAPLFYPETWQE